MTSWVGNVTVRRKKQAQEEWVKFNFLLGITQQLWRVVNNPINGVSGR